nr:ATP synthase F0 subunit 8 [Diploderma vela]
MPQLNLTPWLMVMLVTWLFLLVMMTKIIYSNPITYPVTQNLKTTKTPMTWPWH